MLPEQVLEPKVPVKRAVFHEITQEALVKAFEVRWVHRCVALVASVVAVVAIVFLVVDVVVL